MCTEYFQSRQARDLRTADERERVINVYVYPRLASRPIDTITRRDLIDLLDHIEDNHGQRTADVVLSVLRRIFGWHALRSETFNSPIIAGMGRYSYAQHARHRTLSDDELRKVWHAAGEFPVYGALIKFLLLSAARRAEAAEMTESELDAEGTWELPAVRSKTGEPIVRPLSQAARDVLAGVPRIADCPFYFSLDGQRPFGTFSHWKRRFDAKCGVANWTVHDLRRVSRSLLSRAGVNADHAERVLGHRIGGVRSTYDRHEFFEEKKFALEALAAQIERIVNPVDNVRALRG